ncbi:MAG: hypothetical protein COV34_00405 [Candidatus Zambryskibacteria bacterium CG10_big_fil_rev_8_21_14_0_10_42_12]|uniref:Nucleotidase n=1 Tax=Candidatus Zambryskibacteria bacterium CG10_big_fil_rev_8_21_14_0_10_42_12 TaxID=1975115 RepID=A0A2H0QXP6_9BACT|nr:MAG: hypothetical protein COV34_00405 [Candidatus Zambryskibacteria bacterium CG10_big_fil_rev_8_21_14_0_10_42_12]
MKNQKHIGLDFDDVIFDMCGSIVEYHNKNYGTNLTRDDMVSFEFSDVWKCSIPETQRRVWEFFDSPEHQVSEPVPDAIEHVKELLDNYKVTIVTARPETHMVPTKKWLENHVPELLPYMHFTNGFGGGVKREKGEVCKELGIDIFVEDAPIHIESVSKTVPQVYLFDMPWNKALVDLPKNVERVHSWADLREKLL